LSALPAFVASDEWVRDGGKFVPHPTSWLRGRRWEDEIEPACGEVHPDYRGTKEIIECPRCDEVYKHTIGKPDEHACVVAA